MVTKGYGLTVDDIDWSCPADLEPYAKAHNMEVIEQDNLMWTWWGNYGLSAVSIAIERNLAGKKAKQEYLKESVLSKAFENDGLTEYEIYEKELQKALMAEEMWIMASHMKGLPETIIN